MADPLYELLAPYFEGREPTPSTLTRPLPSSIQTSNYFNRLSTLSLADLTSTEPASLLQSIQSRLRDVQALSKRSHKAVIASTSHITNLSDLLPAFESQSTILQNGVPALESAATEFAHKYDRSTENTVLDRRKRALLLSRNVDRTTDILELPSLLSSTVSAAQASASTSTSSAATSYAAALDLHAHIKRLKALYPYSSVVADISQQAEGEIQILTSTLITSLQSPSLKLAGAMRAIGWLRRVAPDLADDGQGAVYQQPQSTKALSFSANSIGSDAALGALFLICRLRTLHDTLDALEPLRELAEQESKARGLGMNGWPVKQQAAGSTFGSQSERYLKRYIEIFREQSFSIVSMYKSIFPSGLPTPEYGGLHSVASKGEDDTPLASSSPVASFVLHLVDMLVTTLQTYMANVTDKPARESLWTQVLYCAGSLGRLGADFGMMLALLEDDVVAQANDQSQDEDEPEWAQVMKKHRIQAGRLEILARGVGGATKKGVDISPAVPLPTG